MWLPVVFRFPEQLWTYVTVLILTQPLAGATAQKALWRLAGTLVGGLVALLAVRHAAQSPAGLFAIFFLMVAISAYGKLTSRNSYAWYLLFITFVNVVAAAALPTDVLSLAFDRMAEVSLGVAIVLVVDLLLWPSGAGEVLTGMLAARLRDVGRLFDQALSAALAEPAEATGDTPEAGTAAEDPQAYRREMDLAKQAAFELGGGRRRFRRAAHRIVILEDLHLVGGYLATSAAQARRLSGDCGKVVSDVRERLGQGFEAAALALEKKGHEQIDVHGLGEAVGGLSAIDAEPGSEAWRDDLAEGLRRAAEDIEILSGRRASAAEPGQGALRLRSRHPFAPDAAYMRVSLRTAAAACAGLIANFAVGLPVSSLPPTVAFMAAASPVRLSGRMLSLILVTLGAASLLASGVLVFYMPHFQRFPSALIPPFLVLFGLGYLAAKRPKLGLLVTLVALPFGELVFGGVGAPTNLMGPWGMFKYALVGVLSGFVVVRLIFPRTAVALFRRRAATQIDLLRRTLLPGAPKLIEVAATFGRDAAVCYDLSAAAGQEPTQAALDDDRRAGLLTILERLYDAVLTLERAEARADTEGQPAGHEAGEREMVLGAVVTSMERVAGLVRDEPLIDDTRTGAEPALRAAVSAAGVAGRGLLGRVASEQLALEDWEQDWMTARGSG